MKYYVDTLKWGPEKTTILVPNLYVDISVYEGLVELFAQKSPSAQIAHYVSPHPTPLYLVPGPRLGEVNVSILVTDRERDWNSFVSVAIRRNPAEDLGELEVFLTTKILEGDAWYRNLPHSSSSIALSRHFPTVTGDLSEDALVSRPLVDRRSYFAYAGKMSPSWGCVVGPWLVWAKNPSAHPRLVLWRYGADPVSLPLAGHTPRDYLDAIAAFWESPRANLPEEMVGHPAFAVRYRRKVNQHITLYERTLLGAHFDWLAVGYGTFARGETPGAAVLQLGDGRVRANPVL